MDTLMDKKCKIEAVCQICDTHFEYYRKLPLYPGGRRRRYCKDCLPDVLRMCGERGRPKGDFYIDGDGYARIRVDGKMVHEHRHVMSKILGRKLRKGEIVHHKDGDRANNNPSNLELWLHPQMYGMRASDLICHHCGKAYSSV